MGGIFLAWKRYHVSFGGKDFQCAGTDRGITIQARRSVTINVENQEI